MGTHLFTLVVFLMVSSIFCEDDKQRDSRFSIFQIIKFKNEPCIGNTRNGTCFTSAECDNAGGQESGSCADGFGVCCTVILTNGATTSLNQSYIVQSSSTAIEAGTMSYTICPCSEDICRIRFDFTQFQLAAPNTGLGTASDTANSVTGGAIGDCTTDTFSITSPQGGTPVICGTNANQHMIVDTCESSCSKINIGIGGGADTRQWDIMVTQYRCGEEAGGPPGCLQWHMERTGKIRTFNFPDQASTQSVGNSVVHLSNQDYAICIRNDASAQRVCYQTCRTLSTAAAIIANAAGENDSFGVGLSPDAAAKGATDATSFCSHDYIEIVGGTTDAIATLGVPTITVLPATPSVVQSRFCGRFLCPTDACVGNIAANNVSVCSYVTPFRVGVHFDQDEHGNGAATGNVVEDANSPGGIIGFALCYTQPGA